MQSPTQQSETRVRERIIEAALELFPRHGYDGTSVETIVTKAGVTKGAFYYYFSSKEEVLEYLHNQFLDHELKLAKELETYEGTPPEKLRRLVCDLIESIVVYRQNVRVFFQEVDRLPAERREEIKARRRIYQEYVEAIVRQGVHGGYFRQDIDPTIATLGIFGLANYTYRWLRSTGRLPTNAVIGMLAEMAVKSLAP